MANTERLSVLAKVRESKKEAQNLLEDATIVGKDRAVLEVLEGQLDEAEEKKDSKKAKELLQKIGELGKKLGPEYVALINGLEPLDPEKDKLGAEIMFELAALNRLCTRQPFETP